MAKKTPVFDFESGDFVLDYAGRVKTVTDQEALKLSIIKAEQTPRGKDLVYANVDIRAKHYKYGSDVLNILKRTDLTDDVKLSEIQRAVKQAIIYDPSINDVTNISVESRNVEDAVIDYDVLTAYDKLEVRGFKING